MKPNYVLPAFFFGLLIFGVSAVAQNSAFTYQGRLTDTSMPASGTYQMQFVLYDALTGGTQIGSTIENATVAVSNGVFTVQLDYGAAAFPGAERYLEISVRRTSIDSYVPLSPRQRVTSAPHAVRASNAGMADDASSLGGTAASQYVKTTDPRLIDARTPTAGSENYIQNTTSAQTANFNINGGGTLSGTLSAANVIVSAGSASAPSFSIAGDTNTGIYSPGTDRLNFATGGSARMQISTNGNVGVGTFPSFRFHVDDPVFAGRAVYGVNSYQGNSDGYGVYGSSVNNPGYGYGGYFRGGRWGAVALADGGSFFGLAAGLHGIATGIGSRRAIFGEAIPAAGASEAAGVYGTAVGPANTNFGVVGIANGGTINYGVYGQAGGGTTNWAGYFAGIVRVNGSTGIGMDPDVALTGSFGTRLTVWGTIRAGAGNLDGCDLQLGDDVCFYDEQNGSLAVRAFSGVGYAPVRAGGFVNASSITLKKNVTPLKRSDFNSMLRQIVEVPLFTYRYKNESATAPVHTGLIAERSPASVLSADGKAVDLYDFISLNAGATKALAAQVATLSSENQSQKQQIDRQQKQLDQQRLMILGLRKFVCQQNPHAEVCKEDK